MMKTSKIMAIAAAVVALTACTKEQGNCDVATFKKGQEVTLNVTADMPATKVTSELNTTTGAVEFKWVAGDKIKVTVGTEFAEFTLASGAGSANATFTGTMPADGNSFDVQYPVTDPVLTTQTYSSTEALPRNMMKFVQTGCTTSSQTFSLTPQNAALRLNLWGASKTISKIVVTNTTTSATPKPAYTLTMDPAVTLPTTEASAKAFFIVVPAGSWNFSAEIFDNAATPASICTFTPSAAQAFAANTVMNMPAKKVGKFYPGTELEGITIGSTVWAPVNCGYDATAYPYGKLYQWGRKDGCGYNRGSTYTETLIQALYTENVQVDGSTVTEDAGYFYWGSSLIRHDWLATEDDTRWNSGSESSPSKTSNDPCPTGWRVPTNTELTALFGENDSASLVDVNGQNGCYFNGTSTATSGVFLPAAGYRLYEDGSAYERGNSGYYWSSSVSGGYVWLLCFDYGGVGIDYEGRAFGNSVRCVQE